MNTTIESQPDTIDTTTFKDAILIESLWPSPWAMHREILALVRPSVAPELAELVPPEDLYVYAGDPVLVLGAAKFNCAGQYSPRETYSVDSIRDTTTRFRHQQQQQDAERAERAAKLQAKEEERQRAGTDWLEREKRRIAQEQQDAELRQKARDPSFIGDLLQRLAALEGK
jgi:signal transduction histidine kinase